MVAVLDFCAVELKAAGYLETAALLMIAQLDLRARLDGLSEWEIEALAAYCESSPVLASSG